MKACVLEGPKNYQIKDIPVPEMKEDEVLVRVLTSGICVNDVRDYQGCKWSYPRIGGHEYSAVIEHIGTGVDPSLFHIGDKVINYIIVTRKPPVIQVVLKSLSYKKSNKKKKTSDIM